MSYQGLESFKISQGDLVIAVNPVSKKSKLKATNFGADITLISANHPDFNGRDQTSRGEKESFVIDGPGEYEVKDVSIKGFISETAYGGAKLNTIYSVNVEGMNLCFLGPLSNSTLPDKTLEELEGINILFVPIGGEGVLDPATAYKLCVALEPNLIIPTHYNQETLKKFLKEAGETDASAEEKLVVKRKDLEGKEGEIIVLKEE